MRKLLFILPFTLLVQRAPAQTKPVPQRADKAAADPEQVSEDMIKDVDDWLGRLDARLESGKPVLPRDFDSFFGSSFLESSKDPARDMQAAQKRIRDRLGNKAGVAEAYDKWMAEKLSPADLSPRITPGKKTITVAFTAPKNAEGGLKAAVSMKLIKISYSSRVTRAEKRSDGAQASRSSPRKQLRVMPVPAGADSAKYRMKASRRGIEIIFDRLKANGGQAEATK